MDIFNAEKFLERHLTEYFLHVVEHHESGLSAITWTDPTKPINAFRIVGDFLSFLTGPDLIINPCLLINILRNHFMFPSEMLFIGSNSHNRSKPVPDYLSESIPKVLEIIIQTYLPIVQLMFRLCSLKLLVDKEDLQQELKQTHKILSFCMMSGFADPNHEAIVEYIFKRALEGEISKESVSSIKSLLLKAELFQRFQHLFPDSEVKKNKYITQFEEIPMRSIQKRQLKELIRGRSPRAAKTEAIGRMHEASRTPFKSSTPLKTPEKKTIIDKKRSNLKRRRQEEQTELIKPIPKKQVVQRTIFYVRNKKFVPKKIQFSKDSTVTSSCSTLFHSQFDRPVTRNLFSCHALKEQIAEHHGSLVLVQATPIKKQRVQPAVSTMKKQLIPSFSESGIWLRSHHHP